MVYLHQVENYLYYPKFLCILPKMSRETLLDMARHCEIKRAQLLFVLYEVLTAQVSRKEQVQMYELAEMRSDFDERKLL